VPALFSLVVIFAVVWPQWQACISRTVLAATLEPPQVSLHPLDRNQTIKGAVAMLALLVLFTTPLPRETGALIIAALLLANRKITSRTMIAAVDWPLLLLVSCLFAITGALNHSGVAAELLEFLINHGLLPDSLALVTPFSVLMSNAIGGVPTAMLLLQRWQTPPPARRARPAAVFAIAGNLLLTGSLTNVPIAERADRTGAGLGFAEYARAGVPIAVLSLGFAVFWLALPQALPLLR
jgi:Na+/H+ antiporter NhaD/arsenite permease-like protein